MKCHCQLGDGEQAAKIPDCNKAENLFNQIENQLRKMGQAQGWPKNKEELKERIILILDNILKSWFKKTFDSLRNTWKEVGKRKGKMIYQNEEKVLKQYIFIHEIYLSRAKKV